MLANLQLLKKYHIWMLAVTHDYRAREYRDPIFFDLCTTKDDQISNIKGEFVDVSFCPSTSPTISLPHRFSSLHRFSPIPSRKRKLFDPNDRAARLSLLALAARLLDTLGRARVPCVAAAREFVDHPSLLPLRPSASLVARLLFGVGCIASEEPGSW